MFRGNYNFFEYKYNIVGYTGQDYGGFAQKLYLIISVILMVILLISLRKSSKEKVLKIIRGISIFLILFYIGKTTWESVYDIKLSGSFNTGLLPFDTCSIPMLAGLIAGFGKGKIKKYAECWLCTGGIVGGFATMLFLNAFKYYPFLSFGAFYSMIWHFLMVFLGLLLIVTNYVDTDFKTVLNGYIFHVIISLIVIPIDFIFNFDFMLYKDLGGVPIFEGIASKLTSMNLQLLNPILMLILYFIAFNIVVMIPMFIKKIKVQLCK
ncbi:MAG: YwaF family protein [Bacilli bacterium]|nr:YwaF family protein [Bacilli bacterium]